jgi:hypothetical protein
MIDTTGLLQACGANARRAWAAEQPAAPCSSTRKLRVTGTRSSVRLPCSSGALTHTHVYTHTHCGAHTLAHRDTHHPTATTKAHPRLSRTGRDVWAELSLAVARTAASGVGRRPAGAAAHPRSGRTVSAVTVAAASLSPMDGSCGPQAVPLRLASRSVPTYATLGDRRAAGTRSIVGPLLAITGRALRLRLAGHPYYGACAHGRPDRATRRRSLREESTRPGRLSSLLQLEYSGMPVGLLIRSTARAPRDSVGVRFSRWGSGNRRYYTNRIWTRI